MQIPFSQEDNTLVRQYKANVSHAKKLLNSGQHGQALNLIAAIETALGQLDFDLGIIEHIDYSDASLPG